MNGYNAKELKEATVKEKLNWRSFADSGAISDTWKAGPQTFYVIDHRGVIRYKWVSTPGEKALDTALERLIKEAAGNVNNTPK